MTIFHKISRCLAFIYSAIFCCEKVTAQQAHTMQAYYVKIAAGEEYHRSRLHHFLWGKNNRESWTTPVSAKIVMLDTLHGGMVPYKKGGGNESKTLRLRSAAGKEYVLRSVNKSRQAVIPGLLRGSVLADIVQDGVSMSHPYGALAVTGMSTVAGIYHPVPELVYIPGQPRLAEYNAKYGDDLYLLEERPDGDWHDNDAMGNFTGFEGTLKLLKKMRKNNEYCIDQFAYIRSRLFDVLISDWDRQQDNWRWGIKKEKEKRYSPFSRDRDQALYATDGKLTKMLMPLLHIRFMQHFGATIKNAATLTSQDREMDRIFANQMTEADWLNAAAFLQEAITDSIIELSVKNLPAEIFEFAGKDIVRKLQSRRSRLRECAKELYAVLAKKVAVNGSGKDEYFEVQQLNDQQLEVNVYRLQENKKEGKAFYSRIFHAAETKEIKLFGFGGNDRLALAQNSTGIRVSFYEGENKNPLFRKDD